jgi:SagB-type dehydrogenase family enzyme
MTDIILPRVKLNGETSVEAALRERRSVREFSPASLPLMTVGQLLWAAQGVTTSDGRRTAPSAGALYPLELYLAAGRVDGVLPGTYQYRPRRHALRLHLGGDCRHQLAAAALGQSVLRDCAAVLIVAAVYDRVVAEYGSRSHRYVHMEVGHAAQNVYLQAAALGLGTVIIGAFEDDKVHALLKLPENMAPLALLPSGALRSAFA